MNFQLNGSSEKIFELVKKIVEEIKKYIFSFFSYSKFDLARNSDRDFLKTRIKFSTLD